MSESNPNLIVTMQALMGGVMFLMGMLLFLFKSSQSIEILYVAVAILAIVNGLSCMLAAFMNTAAKKEE